MSDEQFQDFHPSQCVILQHQGGEGVRGLYIPLLRNFGYFQPVILKKCEYFTFKRAGQGVETSWTFQACGQ